MLGKVTPTDLHGTLSRIHEETQNTTLHNDVVVRLSMTWALQKVTGCTGRGPGQNTEQAQTMRAQRPVSFLAGSWNRWQQSVSQFSGQTRKRVTIVSQFSGRIVGRVTTAGQSFFCEGGTRFWPEYRQQ